MKIFASYGPSRPSFYREAEKRPPQAESWGSVLITRLKDLLEKHPDIGKKRKSLEADTFQQFATLGTGNHFIEVCLDEEERMWVMLHSGSRGAGNAIASYFIRLAQEECARRFIDLPDKNLAYLAQGDETFTEYMRSVLWAQEYALENRNLMVENTLKALSKVLNQEVIETEARINCHHNYVQWEKHFGENILVTRKGAVSAKEDELGVIPGAMGRKSFIVKGRGNAASFHSCSHGAGRAMSRTQAKRRFTLDDLKAQTAGVECPVHSGIIDELPGCSKSAPGIMNAQSALVQVKQTRKGMMCAKR